jgi:hypothetical protein
MKAKRIDVDKIGETKKSAETRRNEKRIGGAWVLMHKGRIYGVGKDYSCVRPLVLY